MDADAPDPDIVVVERNIPDGIDMSAISAFE